RPGRGGAPRPGRCLRGLRQDARGVSAGALRIRVWTRPARPRLRARRGRGAAAGTASGAAQAGPAGRRQAMNAMTSVVLALALMGSATGAMAAAPTDQLKGATDRVLKLLQDPELKKPDKTAERRKQIRAVANEIFDWQETGKRALARHWQGRTPQQREEFSQLFADLI